MNPLSVQLRSTGKMRCSQARTAVPSIIIASLIETCKLNKVDPLTYLTDVLTRIVNGHQNSEIDQFLPWAYHVKTSKLWPQNDAYASSAWRSRSSAASDTWPRRRPCRRIWPSNYTASPPRRRACARDSVFRLMLP